MPGTSSKKAGTGTCLPLCSPILTPNKRLGPADWKLLKLWGFEFFPISSCFRTSVAQQSSVTFVVFMMSSTFSVGDGTGPRWETGLGCGAGQQQASPVGINGAFRDVWVTRAMATASRMLAVRPCFFTECSQVLVQCGLRGQSSWALCWVLQRFLQLLWTFGWYYGL